jgi:hypothetical protein
VSSTNETELPRTRLTTSCKTPAPNVECAPPLFHKTLFSIAVEASAPSEDESCVGCHGPQSIGDRNGARREKGLSASNVRRTSIEDARLSD